MIYAAYHKDLTIRAASSSGGIYYLLASKVLERNGIVFASAYDGLNVRYFQVENIEGLKKTQGSKYIPSHLGDTFRQIKTALESERSVMFVGVPCQCAGLNSFLGKKYDNLLVVSIVCHGVPSPKAFFKFCSEKKVTGVNMRDKSKGWLQYNWKYCSNNQEMVIGHDEVSFMKGFISDLYLRPSCYECHFKNQVGDITLGDFWGIQIILPEMYDNMGTSIVLTNTEKGQSSFEEIIESIKYKMITGNDYKEYNGGFSIAKVNPNRERFFADLDSGVSFETLVNKLTKETVLAKVKRKIKKYFFYIKNVLQVHGKYYGVTFENK